MAQEGLNLLIEDTLLLLAVGDLLTVLVEDAAAREGELIEQGT